MSDKALAPIVKFSHKTRADYHGYCEYLIYISIDGTPYTYWSNNEFYVTKLLAVIKARNNGKALKLLKESFELRSL